MNPDKITMEVNIAGERISLTVPFSRQEAVRNTEAELAHLHRIWKEKYPAKSPKELLAMMLYQYASHCHDLIDERRSALEAAEDLLEETSRLCAGENDDL